MKPRNDRDAIFKSLNEADYAEHKKRLQKPGELPAAAAPNQSIKELTHSTDRTKTAGERSGMGQAKMHQIN